MQNSMKHIVVDFSTFKLYTLQIIYFNKNSRSLLIAIKKSQRVYTTNGKRGFEPPFLFSRLPPSRHVRTHKCDLVR